MTREQRENAIELVRAANTPDAANVKNIPDRVAGETNKAKTAAAVITCGNCGHEIRIETAAAALGARGGARKVRKGFAVTGQIKRKAAI
jgi:5-enolpyruvylshikimate-3-phosphate synthase